MMASQPAPAPALPDPQSFDQVVSLIGQKREIGLQMEVQRYVKLVSFKPGAIVYESSPEAPADLARKLASRLKDWTGRTWLIAANGQGGGETLIEADRRRKLEERAVVEADPFVKAVMETFPGARLDFRVMAPAVEMPVIPDEATDEDD